MIFNPILALTCDEEYEAEGDLNQGEEFPALEESYFPSENTERQIAQVAR